MPRFEYPCPGCRTRTNLHDAGCDFDGVRWTDIEAAYVDVLSRLSRTELSEAALREAIDDWGGLHAAALSRLRGDQRVDGGDDGPLELLTAAEYKERVTHPTMEPLKTIYEQGSVHGAHDNAVFALVAFYEMVGLSWAETREQMLTWLDESGTWARGGFEEGSPEELVDSKRHVYERGYGWKQAGREAKAVIDRRLG
ncbi:DUF7474 family protein [Halosegnis marinus]|uniref:Uncharacterized protein n=1 Tax=Halosegnis marinus TaxID=3034023 RepID=A0ABD5ZP02_9EURY|nr:hypothetical protein [Halosegnis sp. DT85]